MSGMGSGARGWRGRLRLTTALHAAALFLLPGAALAQLPPNTGPTGGQVSAGQASIAQTATQTTIQQSSQRAAVNWQSFDVGSNHTVTFNQPSSTSSTLNRVIGPNPSEIAGRITANGHIVVVNQAGVVFDKGAQVNAAGITVSAFGMTDQNFMAGKMVFDQPAKAGAQVVNKGTITVQDQGLAALVAPQVRNSGTITAKLGTVVMAGGQQATTLDLYGDGLLSINVTQQVQPGPGGNATLVTNTGTIAAQGGTVILTATAIDGVVQTLVNAGGRISADGAGGNGGRVLIAGAGGDVRVTGTVTADATAPGATGGLVAINGRYATQVAAGARISASGPGGGGTVSLGAVPASASTTLSKIGTGQRVDVAKGATVTANATAKGKGGTIAATATTSAAIGGTVQARGGASGGDGGTVLTSAPTVELAGASVDTSAAAGRAGTWTVSATDIAIGTAAASALQTSLPMTNIVLQSTGGGSGAGDIAVNAAIAAPAGNANSLTLNAFHDVMLNAGLGVGGGTLMLLAGGAVGQTAGGIVAGSLGVRAAAGVDLAGTNAIGTLAVAAPGQGVTFDANSGAIIGSVTDGVTALTGIDAGSLQMQLGGALSLQAATTIAGTATLNAASIAQTATGTLIAGTLAGGSAGAVSLDAASNAIAALGPFTAGGDVAIDDGTTPLQFTGAFNGGGHRLTLTSGAVSQTAAGAITVGTLTGTSTGGVDLGAASNAIGSLGAFDPGGDFTLNDGATPLQVAGAFQGGGHTLTLDAGAISQTASGVIVAGTLSGSSAGAVDLGTATNAIAALGPFTAGGDFTLNDGAAALQFTGAFQGGGRTLTLNTGAVGQTASGAVTVGTLTGTTTGAVDLGTATNAVASLGAFTPDGDFTLNNGATPLQLTGPFQGGANTLTLNAGPISQTASGVIVAGTLRGGSAGAADFGTATNAIAALGPFASGGDFTLNDGAMPLQFTGAFQGGGHRLTLNAGAISQTAAGAITAGTLTGTSTGTVDLGTAANAIASLGSFTPGGDFALNNGATPLQFSGPFQGGAHTLTLNAGPIFQTASGAITAGTLTGSSTGAVDLGTAGNAIPSLGAFASGGDFTLNDGTTPLQFTGAFQGGTHTLALTAGPISQTASGTIAAGALAGSSTGAVDLAIATNAIASLGPFAAGGDFTLGNGATPLQFTGAFEGGRHTLTLTAGPITQTAAGAITAGTLTGTSTGSVNLGAAVNAIATLGGFTAAGGFVLNDGVPLSVPDTVRAGGDLVLTGQGGLTVAPSAVIDAAAGASLTASGGNLTQDGTVSGATVLLAATGSGAILQNGTVTAGAGAATLTAGGGLTNAALGTVSGANGATLTAIGGTLQQDGIVDAGSGAAVLAAQNGPLNQTGTVSGATVQLSASGLLTDSGNVRATAGRATLSGDAGAAVVASGRVSATASAVLQSARGDATLFGTIAAPNVQLLAANGTVTDAGTLTGIGGNPGIDPAKRLTIGEFPRNPDAPGAWILGRDVALTSAALIEPGGGAPAALTVNLSGGGSVAFGAGGSFNNPALQLFLNLNTGTAAGEINVDTLQVAYLAGGSRDNTLLTGTVGGLSGSSAATASFIQPFPKNNYQVNGCPIQSSNCIRISTLSIPVVNPFKDLQLLASQDVSDIDVVLPDVAERDY
ncbi:MAG: filamentous hemagglutinin N-terminal domain-containing protein [Proteobacteria bacterium]|nr:filamentous hemagglutinin N-terminal domain-containing protein [Pseudomonadota bacterium]